MEILNFTFYLIFTFFFFYFLKSQSYFVFPVICLMIGVCKTSGNQRSQTNFHGIKCIIIIIIIAALSQILNTLQIISHLIRHKPTKWISDNQHCCNIYIYIHLTARKHMTDVK